MAITDRTLFGRDLPAMVARCRALAFDGVEFLLLREKDLPAGEQADLARAVRTAIRGTGCRDLIAGRADIALACGLAGVHLSSAPGELTPGQVRQVWGVQPQPFVSVSCHTKAEVIQARDGDADAILFAPVFGKIVDVTEVVAGAGLEALGRACDLAGGTPVFALGGITEQNALACAAAGAAGVAAIRMFMAGPPR